jgi:hypothetical protein
MHSFVRKTMLATALLVAASSMVQAQERREKELRIDVAGLESNDGTTTFGVGLPGTVALGIYMNNKIAIEPTISFNGISGDGNSVSFLQAGVFVPYYFKGDTGRNGLFVSPGLMYSKIGGDIDGDGMIDFGVDVGVKRSMRDNVAMRIAANIRTGDSYEDANGDSTIGVGASFGIGIFWK